MKKVLRKLKESNFCFDSLAIRQQSKDLKHLILGNGLPKLHFFFFYTCPGGSFIVLGSYECMLFLKVVNCKLYSVYSVYCIWCIEFGRMTISFSLHVVPRWRSPFNHFRSEPSLSFFSKPVALSTFESPLPPSVIAAPAFCYSCSPLPPVVGVTSSSCGRRHIFSSLLREIFVS